MKTKKIFIVAGEPSGDLYASKLVTELKALDPSLSFCGLGGALSKVAGVDVIFDISKLALVGVVEVLKHAAVIRQAFGACRERIDAEAPDLAILVDYPGFNLRLAKMLHERGIPVVYYISPQIWAWGKGRIRTIRQCVTEMIVFFDFERALYEKHGVRATFVGHPLVDTVRPALPKEAARERYGIAPGAFTVALLPGSRRSEIAALLPAMARTARIITEKHPGAHFLVAKHPSLPLALYRDAFEHIRAKVKIIENDAYTVLAAADFAVVASGTATLETAIIGTPLVIVYKVHALTAFLARLVKRTPFLGLVNILAGKEIAPEFIQEEMRPALIAKCVLGYIADPGRMTAMRQDLRKVRDGLGDSGATMRAAGAVARVLAETAKKNP